MGYLKRHRLRALVDLLFGGLGTFPHTLLLYELRVRLSIEKTLTAELRAFVPADHDRRAAARVDRWASVSARAALGCVLRTASASI
jgi:hypothetical protein